MTISLIVACWEHHNIRKLEIQILLQNMKVVHNSISSQMVYFGENYRHVLKYWTHSSTYTPVYICFQDAVKIMAKDLVRTRRYVKKFILMRANIQAVALKIQTLKSNNAMAQAMKGVTRAMQTMNRQVFNK